MTKEDDFLFLGCTCTTVVLPSRRCCWWGNTIIKQQQQNNHNKRTNSTTIVNISSRKQQQHQQQQKDVQIIQNHHPHHQHRKLRYNLHLLLLVLFLICFVYMIVVQTVVTIDVDVQKQKSQQEKIFDDNVVQPSSWLSLSFSLLWKDYCCNNAVIYTSDRQHQDHHHNYYDHYHHHHHPSIIQKSFTWLIQVEAYNPPRPIRRTKATPPPSTIAHNHVLLQRGDYNSGDRRKIFLNLKTKRMLYHDWGSNRPSQKIQSSSLDVKTVVTNTKNKVIRTPTVLLSLSSSVDTSFSSYGSNHDYHDNDNNNDEDPSSTIPCIPFLIVLIPAYNEEKRIGTTLHQYNEYLQNHFIFSKRYRILVVNDGSTDSTTQVIQQYNTIHLLEPNQQQDEEMQQQQRKLKQHQEVQANSSLTTSTTMPLSATTTVPCDSSPAVMYISVGPTNIGKGAAIQYGIQYITEHLYKFQMNGITNQSTSSTNNNDTITNLLILTSDADGSADLQQGNNLNHMYDTMIETIQEQRKQQQQQQQYNQWNTTTQRRNNGYENNNNNNNNANDCIVPLCDEKKDKLESNNNNSNTNKLLNHDSANYWNTPALVCGIRYQDVTKSTSKSSNHLQQQQQQPKNKRLHNKTNRTMNVPVTTITNWRQKHVVYPLLYLRYRIVTMIPPIRQITSYGFRTMVWLLLYAFRSSPKLYPIHHASSSHRLMNHINNENSNRNSFFLKHFIKKNKNDVVTNDNTNMKTDSNQTSTISTPFQFIQPPYVYINDTQCGFKLYTYNAAVVLFQNLYIKGWCHDVEIIYKATYLNYLQIVKQQRQQQKQKQNRQLRHTNKENNNNDDHNDDDTLDEFCFSRRNNVVRIAVGSSPVLWEDVPYDSKVRQQGLFRVSLRMLWDILRIRFYL